MTLTDDQLLDFDHEQLADFDLGEAKRALVEHGDVFRAQLVAARHLEGWAERLVDGPTKAALSEGTIGGYENALLEVAAHLRQGDYLPGGAFYDQEVGGS